MRRRFESLLRFLTSRTVFMEIGARDCALALRVAGYVERVWCVEPASRPRSAPCNLRIAPLEAVPAASVDVVLTSRLANVAQVRDRLAPGGVWLVQGDFVAPDALRAAGFARARYFAGGLRVPGVLARLAANATVAAYA